MNSHAGSQSASGGNPRGYGIGGFQRGMVAPNGKSLGMGNNMKKSVPSQPGKDFGLAFRGPSQGDGGNLPSSPNSPYSAELDSSDSLKPARFPPLPLHMIEVPEDLMYDVDTFVMFQHIYSGDTGGESNAIGSSTPGYVCPPGVMQIARQIWKMLPEHMDKLEAGDNLRDQLFAEEVAAAPSKVLHERKLHHEVMGILGKVTEANLKNMRDALVQLPIRQSPEEIPEVVNVFFSKSTRPEDSRYTPLYVNLLQFLLDSMGREKTAEQIRKEIVNQCKKIFLNEDEANNLEKKCANLSPEEAEAERTKFDGKQKANVFFLGLLFVNKLVIETVILAVLEHLRPNIVRNRFPVDTKVTHFIELLETCGPHLSESRRPVLDEYAELLSTLGKSHPKMRIQVLCQNMLETMNNNWIPLHGPKAVKRDPLASSGSPAGLLGHGMGKTTGGFAKPLVFGSPTESAPHVPSQQEVYKAMDEYIRKGSSAPLKQLLLQLPKETMISRFSPAIGRYIQTSRYEEERTLLGERFGALIDEKAIGSTVPQEALLEFIDFSIEENLIEDIPFFFTGWNVVITNGGKAFPSSLNYQFLIRMVEHHCLPEMINDFLKEVDFDVETWGKGTAKSAQNSSTAPGMEATLYNEHAEYVRKRLHVLPALLRYSLPLHTPDAHSKESQERLAHMGECSIEIKAFQELEKDVLLKIDRTKLGKSPLVLYPLFSAIFTYLRFDINRLLSPEWKPQIKKLIKPNNTDLSLLLEDVFLQWYYLKSPVEDYINFFNAIKASVECKQWTLRLKENLTSEYIKGMDHGLAEAAAKLIHRLDEVSPNSSTAPPRPATVSAAVSSPATDFHRRGSATAKTNPSQGDSGTRPLLAKGGRGNGSTVTAESKRYSSPTGATTNPQAQYSTAPRKKH